MKATDLMIGDWVCLKDDIKSELPLKVDGVLIDDISLEGEGFLGGVDGLVRPIPLTAEILEKDGWERDIDKEWVYNNSHILPHYCYQWEKRNVKIEMYSGLEGFTISLIIGRRFYAVHELQQVLRLYGLDELADNFKV